MMNLLTPEMIPELLEINEGPFISLYMPTFKSHPENYQDPEKFRELVKEIETALVQNYSATEIRDILKPYRQLAENFDFWQHTETGLAVLSAKNFFKVIGLQTPVDKLVMVADSFYTKPLRKYLQTLDRYQVLGLSLHEVHFYEGNRHSLVEVELAEGVPATITEALGDQLTKKYLTISKGGAGVGGTSIHHGHGSRNDEKEKDAERFFTVVSRAIAEHYSNISGLPLILAALPEHHNLFQKVSNNPQLLPQGIMINHKSVSIEKLREMAWKIIEQEHLKKMDNLAAQFNQAKIDGIGIDTIEEVSKAANEGRVDTLLLESNRIIPGKTDRETGVIEAVDMNVPAVNDLLDNIGDMVIQKGGKVTVVPAKKMPSSNGVAAILRF